jgi:hypothetical protein
MNTNRTHDKENDMHTWRVEVETTQGIITTAVRAETAKAARRHARSTTWGFVFTRRVHKVTDRGLVGYFTHPFLRTV